MNPLLYFDSPTARINWNYNHNACDTPTPIAPISARPLLPRVSNGYLLAGPRRRATETAKKRCHHNLCIRICIGIFPCQSSTCVGDEYIKMCLGVLCLFVCVCVCVWVSAHQRRRNKKIVSISHLLGVKRGVYDDGFYRVTRARISSQIDVVLVAADVLCCLMAV